MKVCFKCNMEKPFTAFYKHKQMADGFLNKCKECAKKDTKENRKSKSDYYKEYDRNRFQNDPKVRERHKRYQATEAGKASARKSRKKWLENNKEKRKTHNKVNSAIRSGILVRPKVCDVCGCEPKRIEGHHNDYSKPLDVMWLCRKCHTNEHRKPF